MSTTDELRHMLDELGVKYATKDRPMADHSDWEAWMHGDAHQPSSAMRRETLWNMSADGEQDVYNTKATEVNGKLSLEATSVSPEQALAATLLREGFSSMSREHTQTILELSDAYSEIDKLKATTTKLQEIVRDYERCSVHADCETCEYDGKLSAHCPYSPCFPDDEELQELGVRVDD